MKYNSPLDLTPLIDPVLYASQQIVGKFIDGSAFNHVVSSTDLQVRNQRTGATELRVPKICAFWTEGDLTVPNLQFALLERGVLHTHSLSELVGPTSDPSLWPQGQTKFDTQFGVLDASGFSYRTRVGYAPSKKYGSPGSVIEPPNTVRVVSCRMGGVYLGGNANLLSYSDGFDTSGWVVPDQGPGGNVDFDTGLAVGTNLSGQVTQSYLQQFTDSGQSELVGQVLAFDLAYLNLTRALQAQFPSIYFQFIPMSYAGLNNYLNLLSSPFYSEEPRTLGWTTSETMFLGTSRFLLALAESTPTATTTGRVESGGNVGSTTVTVSGVKGAVRTGNFIVLIDSLVGIRRVTGHSESASGDTISISFDAPLVSTIPSHSVFSVSTFAAFPSMLTIAASDGIFTNQSTGAAYVTSGTSRGSTVIGISGLMRPVSNGDWIYLRTVQSELVGMSSVQPASYLYRITGHSETDGVTTEITLDRGLETSLGPSTAFRFCTINETISVSQLAARLVGREAYPAGRDYSALTVVDTASGFAAGASRLYLAPGVGNRLPPPYVGDELNGAIKPGTWISFSSDNILYRVTAIEVVILQPPFDSLGLGNPYTTAITIEPPLVKAVPSSCALIVYSEEPCRNYVRGNVLNLIVISDVSLGFSNPYYQSFPGGMLNEGIDPGSPKMNKYVWSLDVQLFRNTHNLYERNQTTFFYDDSPALPAEQVLSTFAMYTDYFDPIFAADLGAPHVLLPSPCYANADLPGVGYTVYTQQHGPTQPYQIDHSATAEVVNVLADVHTNTENWLQATVADQTLTPSSLGFSYGGKIQYGELDVARFVDMISRHFGVQPVGGGT